jgi:hypothetical protein
MPVVKDVRGKHPAKSAASASAGGIKGGGTVGATIPVAPITFSVDDGSYENNIGWGTQTVENAAIWMNRFTPPAGSFPILLQNISIEWPTNTGGTVVGKQAKLVIYSDIDGNGDPSNAVLLSQSTVTIASLNTFENYPVNVVVPGPTGDIYVGFEDFWAEAGFTPKLFPAAIDTSSASQQRSWIAAMGDGSPPDLTNLSNNDILDTVDNLAGLPGNWLIRASGQTGLVVCASPTVASTATRTSVPTSVPNTATRTSVPAGTATNTPPSVASATSTSTTPQPTSTTCPIQFSDVPVGSTFYEFIRCLACRGIINGYPDGTFRPNNNVTRGQLSKIVSNSAGFSDPATQMFEDVPPGSTFFDYIGRLASRGYINGYPCGGPGEPCVPPGNLPYFRPNANATRGQISKIVANAAGFIEPVSGQTFEDVPPGSTFYDFIERLASRNVMQGYPCGSIPGEPCVPPGNRPYFRPSNNATRGQTSKIVANTFFPNCITPSR